MNMFGMLALAGCCNSVLSLCMMLLPTGSISLCVVTTCCPDPDVRVCLQLLMILIFCYADSIPLFRSNCRKVTQP